ncbi:MAG TPA: MiaB/RimO family radical SAM methylthiotransferase, partial [Acidimicrobiales bacterium]|nr:MiaB/RimO family radical SAM methylthiotransferase [Acidimicrobiales bacterium]
LQAHLMNARALKERDPGKRVVVGGCWSESMGDRLFEEYPFVDFAFGPGNVARLGDFVDAEAAAGDGRRGWFGTFERFAADLPLRRERPFQAWLQISMGCNSVCAYCIVPSVRGRERSRPVADVVAEAERLAADGVVELTLLGQNVNSYGRDLTRRRPLFAELLRAVGEVDGIRRVRFTSPHPKDLRPETIDAMATSAAACEHLHLPLQSGSDRTLAAMHRGYTAARYLEKLAAARAAIPDLAVTTDLIVGFPGETDDDFERTLEVVAEAAYDSAYTFVFSPRPGTQAAEMADRFVPAEVIAERFERLKIVVERSALARHQARIGRVEEVLVEGPSKKDPAVATGRTRQNKLVHFPVGVVPAAGTFADVLVTGSAAHYLRGELVEVTARPRHKTRIPVAVL